MSRIKQRPENNKVSSLNNKELKCFQDENDMLFEFGHITEKKKYSLDAFIETCSNDKRALLRAIDLLKEISNSTWIDLKRGKRSIGGYETLEIPKFHTSIWDKLDKPMTDDTKLFVFRFGNQDKYRMVVYRSTECKRVIHVLGFDLDFSLYDHGN